MVQPSPHRNHQQMHRQTNPLTIPRPFPLRIQRTIHLLVRLPSLLIVPQSFPLQNHLPIPRQNQRSDQQSSRHLNLQSDLPLSQLTILRANPLQNQPQNQAPGLQINPLLFPLSNRHHDHQNIPLKCRVLTLPHCLLPVLHQDPLLYQISLPSHPLCLDRH
jgi:hypothetical protein